MSKDNWFVILEICINVFREKYYNGELVIVCFVILSEYVVCVSCNSKVGGNLVDYRNLFVIESLILKLFWEKLVNNFWMGLDIFESWKNNL